MDAPDPDLPLWKALQRGDDAMLDVLMERHGEKLFRFIYRHVPQEEDARDLLQETFVRAYFKKHLFEPRVRVTTWLHRIALNLCRDRARSRAGKQQRRTDSLFIQTESGVETLREIASTALRPDQIAADRDQMIRLHAAIATLPPKLKTAFVCTVLEDRSRKECAELLGLTVKAVDTRIARARHWLKKRLKP